MRLIDADALIHELNNSHYPGAPYIDAGISIAIGKVCDAPTIEPIIENEKDMRVISKNEHLKTNHNAPFEEFISRKAAIDALHTWFRDGFDEDKWWNSTHVLAAIESLPSAQPDLSEYSDKLWKAAYERGRAEAQADIVRCKDCVYAADDDYHHCSYVTWWNGENDFCSHAERKTE